MFSDDTYQAIFPFKRYLLFQLYAKRQLFFELEITRFLQMIFIITFSSATELVETTNYNLYTKVGSLFYVKKPNLFFPTAAYITAHSLPRYRIRRQSAQV